MRSMLNSQNYAGITSEIHRYRSIISENDREQLLTHARLIKEAQKKKAGLLSNKQILDRSMITTESALREKESQLEKKIQQLRDLENKYKRTTVLYGDIVQRFAPDIYEVITEWGRHAILKTTGTEFRTTGSFHLSVNKTGTEDVRLKSGFTQTWAVYTEFNYEGNRQVLRADKSALEKGVKSLEDSRTAIVKSRMADDQQYNKAGSIIASHKDSLFILLGSYHENE